MDAAPKPDGGHEGAPAKSELPTVESPPLSPATESAAPRVEIGRNFEMSGPIASEEPLIEPPAATSVDVADSRPRFVLRPRHRRYAVLAASVTFAAALGAVIGALAGGGSPPPAKPDVAAIEQNKALQQSITKLNKEVAVLKANLEQSTKTAHTQIAKISEKLEQQAAEITGSIAPPQTVPATVTAPLPPPRPTQRLAALQPPPPVRIPVVAGWTIRDVRNGYVFVESRGAVYQVQIGAPLPGLGPVQSVKRQDGHWMVVTPKGIIVSMRDRGYFVDF